MALTGRQILDSITPAVEVCGIEIQSTGTDNSGVSIHVEFLVHDVIENNQISDYLSAGVFDKYIKVKVNVSSTTDVGYVLIMPEHLRPQNVQSSSRYFAEDYRLHELFTDKNFYRKKTLEDGRIVKSFKFKKEYRFNSCPTTFVLYAQSVIDTDGLEEELGIPSDSFSQNIAMTQAKAERFELFREKNLVSKRISYIYYEDNSSSGGLARTPVEYMGGVTPVMSPIDERNGSQVIGWLSSDGIELEKVEEDFTNVQDFRIRFAQGTSVARAYGYTESQERSNIESVYSQLSNLERESIKKHTDSLHQQSSISSDLWLTRGASGVVNFIFFLYQQ